MEIGYCTQNFNLDILSQKRGIIQSKCKSELWDFVIGSCIFTPNTYLKFQSYNCFNCGDLILHAKLKSGFSKSEKGHNSVKMQIRVMGLCYMVLDFHHKYLFEVSKL